MANGLIEEVSVQDIADAIRTKNEQTTKYKPAEMKQAILDLVDTTDATAGESDIAKGKTAYVDNEKITGTVEDTVPTYPTTKPVKTTYSKNVVEIDLSDYSNKIVTTYKPSETDETIGKDGIILRPNIPLEQPHTDIVGLENLTAENIKKDISIAGVTGIYDVDLSELVVKADTILGKVESNWRPIAEGDNLSVVRFPKQVTIPEDIIVSGTLGYGGLEDTISIKKSSSSSNVNLKINSVSVVKWVLTNGIYVMEYVMNTPESFSDIGLEEMEDGLYSNDQWIHKDTTNNDLWSESLSYFIEVPNN